MTALDQKPPCSLQNDAGLRGSHNSLPWQSDYKRVLAFCLKRTSLRMAEQPDFQSASQNEFQKITARSPDTDQAGCELIAELTVLGQRAIQTTAALLEPDLKRLAAEFIEASDQKRTELCNELFETLLTPTSPVRTQGELLEHIWDDRSNQSCNRIFARQFSKHGNPNCLGRAQIMLAVARLVGAPVLGATPLIPGSEIAMRHDARLARGILRQAERQKVALKPELISFFEFIITRPDIDRLRPAMFHMGIMLHTGEDGWTLIDPHAKQTGRYRNQALISRLEQQSRQNPEAMLTADFRAESDLTCNKQLWQLKSITEFLEELQTLRQTGGCNIKDALVTLAESHLLEFIRSDAWNIPRAEKENIAAILRGAPSPTAEQISLVSLSEEKYPQSISRRIQALLAYFLLLDCGKEFTGLLAFHVSDDTQSLRQEMLQSAFGELLDDLMARCHGFLFNRAALGSDRGLLHPVLELYQPEFRIGVELVSHVNAVTLRSDQITQTLSRVCTGQTIQISQATGILRHKNATIPLSSRLAFDTLNTAEIQSDRLQEILKRISLKLSLTSGSSHQHDT
ncbi:hypothetical protein [Gimesia maris]|uniref:hypothetical protein n=1 Tax=Gimesia maris TaxID=122 RepID=UPI0032EFC8E4